MIETMWKKSDEKPLREEVVVAIWGGMICYAKIFDGVDWIQCENDGNIVHGRDGSLVYIKPDWWCYPPAVA